MTNSSTGISPAARALDKVGNVQVGTSVQVVSGTASCARNWRLFPPRSWDEADATSKVEYREIRRRQDRARIPDMTASRRHASP
ncbi:transposase [Corynebacterium halotolerans]|uniref:transposase n=1 Tax=Corynebacterium halotolerans TaxID=225326 RepID=UPI003CF0630E